MRVILVKVVKSRTPRKRDPWHHGVAVASVGGTGPVWCHITTGAPWFAFIPFSRRRADVVELVRTEVRKAWHDWRGERTGEDRGPQAVASLRRRSKCEDRGPQAVASLLRCASSVVCGSPLALAGDRVGGETPRRPGQ